MSYESQCTVETKKKNKLTHLKKEHLAWKQVTSWFKKILFKYIKINSGYNYRIMF